MKFANKKEYSRNLKVVILTNGNPHALRVLKHLDNSNIKINSIVLERNTYLKDHVFKTKELYLFRLIKAVRRLILRKLEIKRLIKAYEEYTNVIEVNKLNSIEMVDIFQEINPDLIILGGIGIIDKKIIDTARIGVLNSHPGLLPWIRGSGVIGRAIERDIAIGATCHWVDSDVDTGPIVERRLLKIDKNYSLKQIEDLADLLISEMLAETLINFYSNNLNTESINQSKKYPICKKLSDDEKESVEVLLKEGKAERLFLKWKRFCNDDDKLILNTNINL